MENSGNMMFALFHYHLLDLSLPLYGFIQAFYLTDVQRTHFADAVFCFLLNYLPVIIIRKQTVHLSHFLIQTQFSKQILCPFSRRQPCIKISFHSLSSIHSDRKCMIRYLLMPEQRIFRERKGKFSFFLSLHLHSSPAPCTPPVSSLPVP